MACFRALEVGTVDGQEKKCSQSEESGARRSSRDHTLVIATFRCLTVVRQPSLQEFKKKKKSVPEQIKKTAPLPWAVLAGGCPPAVLLWVCSCSTCSLGHCQILRYWP